ncbi:Actin- protein 10 [Gaertneriomyces sp. JEL0708]|nr:Actin- protein 10 [Gaertneriomyces sp. JEL0708]
MASFVSRRSLYATEDRIVFDIGSLYLKCGFSGESSPRHIVPNSLPVPATDVFQGCIAARKLHPVWGLNVPPATYEYVRQYLSYLLRTTYSNSLLTDPKQRKVVICESPLLPAVIRHITAQIMFKELDVPLITFIPSSVAALLTVGKTTGLVVDCGHLETTVVPVYDGKPLIHNTQALPLAGAAISCRLKLLLQNHGSLLTKNNPEPQPIPADILDAQSLEFFEDLKARVCHVAERPNALDRVEATMGVTQSNQQYAMYSSNAESATVSFNATDRLSIPGWIRERATEVLFEGDEDARSLGTIIADVLLKCPTDIRPTLVSSVLLIGGTSMLPGFASRLHNEILHTMEDPPQYQKLRRLSPKVKLCQSVFKGNCAAWVGASLVGVLKIGGQNVTKEEYLMNGQLPDWAGLRIPVEEGPVQSAAA